MYPTYNVNNRMAVRTQAFAKGMELIFVGAVFTVAGIKLIEFALSD